jgi:hypothetical protein
VDPGLIRENSRKITAIPRRKASRPEGVRSCASAKAARPKPKRKIDFRNHPMQAESKAQGLARAQAAGSAGAADEPDAGLSGELLPEKMAPAAGSRDVTPSLSLLSRL